MKSDFKESYLTNLSAGENSSDERILEIILNREEEFDLVKSQLKLYCLIAHPKLEMSLKFVEKIGSGAQASVELYQERLNEVTNGMPKPSYYAVKRYRLPEKDDDDNLNVMLNEIKFLRKLSACENIVTLESVYYEEKPLQMERCFMLVMIFAKYGSLLNFIENK